MISRFAYNTAGRVAAAALILGLAACQSEGLTSQDMARTPVSLALGPVASSTPEFGKFKICKSASSNVSGTFTISRSAVGASTGSALTSATIAPGNCVVVAEDAGSDGTVGSTITVTETSPGLASITGQRIDGAGGGIVTAEPFSNGDSRFVNQFHGYTFTFTNTVSVPTAGNNGCSPGYFKNHAFPAGFTSSTTFASVFGNNVFGSATLLDVLKTGGGGLEALGRQTVAAFFNATIYADFGFTAAEVVAEFNAVVPGSSADQKSLKDTFEALTDVNGRICTNPTGK